MMNLQKPFVAAVTITIVIAICQLSILAHAGTPDEAESDGLPDLTLHAIAWSNDPAKRLVAINFEVLKEGMSIEGYEIIEIQQDQVKLLHQGKIVFKKIQTEEQILSTDSEPLPSESPDERLPEMVQQKTSPELESIHSVRTEAPSDPLAVAINPKEHNQQAVKTQKKDSDEKTMVIPTQHLEENLDLPNDEIKIASQVYRCTVPLANIRRSPSADAQILLKIKKNTKLNSIGNQGEWLKIKLLDGSEGWIHNSLVTKIIEAKYEK